jgi:hypothetical protein
MKYQYLLVSVSLHNESFVDGEAKAAQKAMSSLRI